MALLNLAPQPPQNFADGWFSKWQLGQLTASGAPHSLQNRRSGAFSVAHPEQRIPSAPVHLVPVDDNYLLRVRFSLNPSTR
jgi:hypothetical protein